MTKLYLNQIEVCLLEKGEHHDHTLPGVVYFENGKMYLTQETWLRCIMPSIQPLLGHGITLGQQPHPPIRMAFAIGA